LLYSAFPVIGLHIVYIYCFLLKICKIKLTHRHVNQRSRKKGLPYEVCQTMISQIEFWKKEVGEKREELVLIFCGTEDSEEKKKV